MRGKGIPILALLCTWAHLFLLSEAAAQKEATEVRVVKLNLLKGTPWFQQPQYREIRDSVRVLVAGRQFKNALRYLEELSKDHSSNTDYQLLTTELRGSVDFAQGDYRPVLREADAVRRIGRENAERYRYFLQQRYYTKAKCYLGLGDYAAVIRHTELYLANYPKEWNESTDVVVSVLQTASAAFERQGDWPGYGTFLLRLLENETRGFVRCALYLELGGFYDRETEYQRARSAYRKAKEWLEPDSMLRDRLESSLRRLSPQ